MRNLNIAAVAVFVVALIVGVALMSGGYMAQAEARDEFMSGCIKMGLDSGLMFTETIDECESAWKAIDNGWLVLEDG